MNAKNLASKDTYARDKFYQAWGTTMDEDTIPSAPDWGTIELRCEVWGESVDDKVEEDEDDVP